MPVKFTEITVFIVIFLFLFFGLFLITYRKGNRLSKNLLGLFFWALGFSVLDIWLSSAGFYNQYPQYNFILNFFPLVYGPLLFLLTKSVTQGNFKIKFYEILHFVPLIIAVTIFFFAFHILDLESKKLFLEKAKVENVISPLISIIVFITISVYLLLSLLRVKRYRSEIREKVSNIDQINLGWLNHTLIGFSIIMILSILVQIINNISINVWWLHLLLLILLSGMLIFIMSSIVRGLKSDVLFEESSKFRMELIQKEKIQIESAKIALLEKFLNSEKPFLDPSINLTDLAEKLNMSSKELSQTINHGMSKSFFDLINMHRIKYFQNIFLHNKDEKLTILEAMYASGFNSKSSFNTAFKKHSGTTPSEWKKKNVVSK